jgi:anti-sigma factor RsiW
VPPALVALRGSVGAMARRDPVDGAMLPAAARAMHACLPKYARAGVHHAWLVDVETRVVTAHRLQSGLWLTIGTYSAETEARIEPFEDVPLDVAQWWLPEGAAEGEREER